MLEGNGKKVGKDDPKLHSLVRSPGAFELLLFGNNSTALEKYTRKVMNLVAKNVTLKKQEAGRIGIGLGSHNSLEPQQPGHR
jgi:hypothetical protein